MSILYVLNPSRWHADALGCRCPEVLQAGEGDAGEITLIPQRETMVPRMVVPDGNGRLNE